MTVQSDIVQTSSDQFTYMWTITDELDISGSSLVTATSSGRLVTWNDLPVH